jgi:pantoate--beta-alanine ligase
MQSWADNARRSGKRLAVVPTMGFLHDGHLSLLRLGRERADSLIMTLFVNPTQFGPNEDLSRYPRDEVGDIAKAAAIGTDIVFCPDPKDMYGPRHDTTVMVPTLSKPLCGVTRPGHFAGVATVVAKLFHLTWPHVAVFGEKDYQQLSVIRRMVRDLNFAVEIVSGPIVRESDGLALSSRNAYLNPEERQQATYLYRGLREARNVFKGGTRDAKTLVDAAADVIAAAPMATIEYLEIRDASDLSLVQSVTRPAILAVAVRIGQTRLIDNVLLD